MTPEEFNAGAMNLHAEAITSAQRAQVAQVSTDAMAAFADEIEKLGV